MSQPAAVPRLGGMTNMKQTSVLITGGNKGLGFEAARRLGEQGWTVFLGSRDEGRGRAAADKLAADGANVVMVPLDVTSDESVAEAVRLVREHTDRLDVLINNAGAPGNGRRARGRDGRRAPRRLRHQRVRADQGDPRVPSAAAGGGEPAGGDGVQRRRFLRGRDRSGAARSRSSTSSPTARRRRR